MATREVDHLLVGGGIASATCAAELRALGAGGSITIVGRERDGPYHRPPVTKGYLRGEEERVDALVRGARWWRDNEIELLAGAHVVALDPRARRAELAGGEEIRFGRALLATGALVRRTGCDGEHLDGVHHLRTLDDTDALRATLADAEHVVLVGGSYVACEVAASLAALGKRCTIVMREPHPFADTFGATAGRYVGEALASRGIALVTDDTVERHEGRSGRVTAVRTVRGHRLDADAVIVGVGVVPEITLARGAGLAIGTTGGVRCDASLRSSHPAVVCAGDVCEYDSVVHGRPLRVEHENAAVEQGSSAARAMLGERHMHTAVPYASCELADWVALEYVGPAATWDDEVLRGSVDQGDFSVWYLRGGQVVGALMVSRPADVDIACGLIASHVDLGDRRHLLTDPAVDLSALAGAAF